jgi:hypothetical protein
MRDLIDVFLNAVSFVDGTKMRTWRPTDPKRQEAKYDGHHHFHCHAVLVWCDVYGAITRLDFCEDGSRHDRGIYNNCETVHNPADFFSDDSMLSQIQAFKGKKAQRYVPSRGVKEPISTFGEISTVTSPSNGLLTSRPLDMLRTATDSS